VSREPRHQQVTESIERDTFRPARRSIWVVTFAVLLLGGVAVVLLFVR
jgi:uncharacterized membrane protein YidH (DUF202 family)